VDATDCDTWVTEDEVCATLDISIFVRDVAIPGDRLKEYTKELFNGKAYQVEA